MTPELSYCRKWFAAKRIALDPLSEAKAKSLHSAGKPFAVLVGFSVRPNAVIDVLPHFVGVDFLDELQREQLTYHFQVKESGRLFLTMAVHREFVGETDQVESGATYTFQTSGQTTIRRERFVPAHSAEVAETSTDVTPNWEPAPAFGLYDGILKVERRNA